MQIVKQIELEKIYKFFSSYLLEVVISFRKISRNYLETYNYLVHQTHRVKALLNVNQTRLKIICQLMQAYGV